MKTTPISLEHEMVKNKSTIMYLVSDVATLRKVYLSIPALSAVQTID